MAIDAEPGCEGDAASRQPKPATARSILLLNQPWFAPQLRARGHRVVTASWKGLESGEIHFPRGIQLSDLFGLLPPGFTPDALIYFDDSYYPSVAGLEDCPAPSIFYSIDTHHHHRWHRYFSLL